MIVLVVADRVRAEDLGEDLELLDRDRIREAEAERNLGARGDRTVRRRRAARPGIGERRRLPDADAAVERAARIGDDWIIGPHSAIEELERQVHLFQKTWAATGKSGNPQLPIIRETFVARNRQEAVEKARPCLEQLYRSIYIKWKQNEAMSDPGELSWAFDRLAKNRFILGSPDECIEQIREYETRLGTNYMLVRFDWTPGLPQQEILASMRLFGEKVIQRL